MFVCLYMHVDFRDRFTLMSHICKKTLSILKMLWYSISRKDGGVVYRGCLENSWVNSPGGSNPSPSVYQFGDL